MTNKEQLDNKESLLNEPLAIVGANCQFPGITKDIEDLDAFHEMLLNELTPIRDVPKNRWDINEYYDADRQKRNKMVSRKGGFLDDPQLFDAAFFKISPIEAKQMDPQHRLFLEVAVRALNEANIPLDALKHSNTGVYCGLSTHDYSQLNYKDKIPFDAYTYIGSADSAAAGRLAYFLNLQGPCITVDTACSSSMSALYLAAMALRTQQCEMAIVGGVHLSLCPEVWVGLSKANMLSAMSESRSFDAEADGYVRSEGCAVIIVKRLSDAIRDQNKIHAVIKSITMNQDGGGMGMGIAAPNKEAQIAMHQSALEKAQLKAHDIDFIETHGTGTLLGDSIELQAIQSIHQGKHAKDNPLLIGALKSNLGHTISASGLAALIKAIGLFKQEMIPANLHYSTPNNAVDLDSISALIPVHARPFPRRQNKKRYVQISNFGFTGTNVSAILEEPPPIAFNDIRKDNDEEICFVISANSEFSLHQLLQSHLHYLKTSTHCLSDIGETLINCRDHYKLRCAIIAKDKESLIKKIESGDYTIRKTIIEKEITFTEKNAKQNRDYFLAGANLKSDPNKVSFKPVDLPLYVFDRKPYWHDIRATKETRIPEDWCFELTWQSQPMDKSNYREAGRRWLLIGDQNQDFGLREKGLTIIREKDNYSFDELDGIIFAEHFDSSTDEVASRIDQQKNTLKKILALLRVLNDNAIALRIIFLTHHATAVLSKDNIRLDSSPLVGFCKTLCLELPHYQTILLDWDKQDEGHFAEHIIDEASYNHGQHYDHIVAYRKGTRLVSRLKRTLLPQEKKQLNPKGRYLITGGCGGLGLVTSHALLSAGAKEIILVSRTINTPSIMASIKKIQTDFPTQMIRPVSLDITDKMRLHQLLLEINKDGLLKGIIHAAGVSINKSLLTYQDQDIDHLFSPKVNGGWYLHELSQHLDLDFFVVYSSISSVFGSNKESIYSATNSFLDALIAERQRLGLVGTAIQWGPWAEVGMAAIRSRDTGLKNAFIQNEQGHAFIQRIFHSDLRYATIIPPEYLQFMLDFVPEPQAAFYKALAHDLTQRDPVPDTKRSQWLTDYFDVHVDDQLTVCKNLLSTLCKELLGIEQTDVLDEDSGFFEMGLDSLMMAALATRLKEHLNPLFPVATTVAFDYPSINQLSRHIQTKLNHQFLKEQKSNKSANPYDDAIAIIGMSCSLPNAPNIATFEQLLEKGLSGIKEIPVERWDNQHYYDPNPDTPGKTYVNALGLIDNITLFDPQFFGISPREAPFLDPQQRLFLENCYHALENANYPVSFLRGSSTGVFAGVGSSHEYYTLLEKRGFSHEEMGMFSVTGKALNIIPGRVAYTFDFKGPALSIDTACSSSLVAIHYACSSLKNREIDFALAGGVNVLLRPDGVIHLSQAKALSLEGQCKTFDEKADGYVRSEGCGVLFLKRMTDALRDKDTILAVIKGSAVNNDGKSAGLTVPNGKSQEDVIRKALSQAQLVSSDISYVEAHGTGTPLGDPIEVHAINAVYGKQRGNDNPLYIGTVKTNIGHLESAAGVAGLIKVIIGLQKKKIYKNLNFNRLNPHINLDTTQIALHNREWKSASPLKSAGISAFGFSGTNAHIILQEFPDNAAPKKSLPMTTNALVLSGKSRVALDNLIKCYQSFLASTTEDFNNLCFTAATCRDHYPYRLALVARDAFSASELLYNGEFAVSDGKNNLLHLPDNKALSLLINDYLQGKQVDWITYYTTHHPALTKVALPCYPFDRKKYWLVSVDNCSISRSTPTFRGVSAGAMDSADMPRNVWIEPKCRQPLDLKDKNNAHHDRLYSPTETIASRREDKAGVKMPFEKKPSFNLKNAVDASLAEHLYEIKWTPLKLHSPNKMKLPVFWVISSDETRAKKVLGHVKYHLIDNIDKLDHLGDKNILFLYEENQFQALFYCCQKMFTSLPASFTLITENAYAINNSAPVKVNPHHTMAYTFWKSFKNELEFNKNYAIDLDSESSLNENLNEIFNTPHGETQFAVRDTIYVPRLKKKRPCIGSTQQQKTVFHEDASYLITGGTGGLAKPLIEYLMSNGVKHIVITSRSECSLETQRWLERARKNEVEITHYAADASDLPLMQKIIENIQQSPHPLKGVFHLAGTSLNDLIIHLKEETLQQVFRSKMESAFILHELTKDITLDLFVLFSSASSILGSRRQAHYAAANGFLDGLAHLRHQNGLPALAINWGVFQTEGMAAGKIDSLKKRGFIPLNEQSIDILDFLLRSHLPQIVLCPIHWDIYFKNAPSPLAFFDQDETMSSPSAHTFLNFLQQHSSKEQNDILSQILCEIAANVLGLTDVEDINKKNDLFAMGMDSLMALELRSRIHDKLQCPDLNLPIEHFINEPRIDKITDRITKELSKFFSQNQNNAPTEELRVGAITLSDTQYGFWLINKMGSSFNCPKQIQLHGKLNIEYLSKAIAVTINKNNAFWLNFHNDIPIQTLKRQGEFTLFYEDISSDYDQDTLNEVFYKNTTQLISLTEQPLIKVYLYKLKEELHELHIIIPHIILDESSYQIFLDQLKDNYKNLVREKNLIPVQEQYGYLDYVKRNNGHYEKNLKDKIDFWQAYNNGFQKLSFGRPYHLPDAAKQSKNLFHYPLDESLVEKFKAWHKEKNINVSTGLITAFHIVFYKISAQKKIPAMVLHHDREGSRYESVVGLFLEYKRINITLNEKYNFIEFFNAIENEFIKAAPFQKCSQYIKNTGLKKSHASIGQNAVGLYHKLLLSKKFKMSHPNPIVRPYYLENLSKAKWLTTHFVIKDQLNRVLRTRLRLLKPNRLTVVFNITIGFLTKQPRDNQFADLEMTIPNHYGSVDRPIGNQTLWIYFTKDQYNQYRLSINGPLTPSCKDLLAQELKNIMTKIMENDEYRMADLIGRNR